MAGLVPGIHALRYRGKKDVDGRVKPTAMTVDVADFS
jgi:hypothetical protein